MGERETVVNAPSVLETVRSDGCIFTCSDFRSRRVGYEIEKKFETFLYPRCTVSVSGPAKSDGAAWVEFLLVSAVGCYQLAIA